MIWVSTVQVWLGTPRGIVFLGGDKTTAFFFVISRFGFAWRTKQCLFSLTARMSAGKVAWAMSIVGLEDGLDTNTVLLVEK